MWRKRKEKIQMLIFPELLSSLCLGFACVFKLFSWAHCSHKGCLPVGEQGRSRKPLCFNLLAGAFDNKLWMCRNPETHPPASEAGCSE